MEILDVPFTVTNWKDVDPVEYKGETGTSFWRVFQAGNIRARIVEYSPNFRSDHWCPRGHIFLVLEGEFGIALKDGRNFLLSPSMSFEVSDDEANPHLGYSEGGAKVFIID